MTPRLALAESDPLLSPAKVPRPIEEVRASIASWLLDAGVQLRAGPNAGGVVGAIDADGRASYVYPEITGYFLQWLAWMATKDTASAALSQRASAAQDWLATWIDSTQPPRTRVYLRVDESDWRNCTLFTFDLAMVLRGLASAVELGLIREDERLVTALVAQLSRLVAADGQLLACAATAPTDRLPARWSTRRGGFLAKAAAGILAAARVFPQVTLKLRDAAASTLVASIGCALDAPHSEVHPRLYAIEGALAFVAQKVAGAGLARLVLQIDDLLAAARDRGLLRESLHAGVERIDAVAQCLRAAYLFYGRQSDWSPAPDALEAMQRALVRHTSAEGSLPFAAGDRGASRNVWTAMFAEQALRLAQEPSPLEACRRIV